MIALHPIPDCEAFCPHCAAPLTVVGWRMPGMRTLAELRCPRCRREYFGDLPAAAGLYYPMLLERAGGAVHDPHNVRWFADWLRESYAARSREPLRLTIERAHPPRNPVLLNCLDRLYGHALLKLLNASRHLDGADGGDLIVLAPSGLRWLLPEGVAEAWLVDWPLRCGARWSDWLADEIAGRVAALGACRLSRAYSHPRGEEFRIERFTRVAPFALREWGARLAAPVVTFVWRDDRAWSPADPLGGIIALAERLRAAWPALDFALVGLAQPGGAPAWIADVRCAAPDAATERRWCERYARSHVVIGVHGSNMLLPSAHAGATIDLMPDDRWRNATQDLIYRPDESAVDATFRRRLIPVATSPVDVARIADALLREYPHFAQKQVRAPSVAAPEWQCAEPRFGAAIARARD